mmetsp:Transcript_25475/g.35744  ORF Transcript_25475/g.35744 Transcript_25475/m.35744 type:complete len:554 (+) Transcript_25475:1386-3047(+)
MAAKRKAPSKKTKEPKDDKQEEPKKNTVQKKEEQIKDDKSTEANNNNAVPKKSSLKKSSSPKKKVRFSKKNQQMEIEARESEPEEEPLTGYARLMQLSIMDNFDDDSSDDQEEEDQELAQNTQANSNNKNTNPTRKIQTRSSKRQKIAKTNEEEELPPANTGLFGKKPEEEKEQPTSLLELIKQKSPKDQKPKKYNIEYKKDASSLEELGYKFQNEVLVDKDGDGFVFIDQDHYKLLCELVAKEIQKRLVQQYKFVEVLLPLDEADNNNNNHKNGKESSPKKKTSPKKSKKESEAKPDEKKEDTPKVNIFHSNDFFTNKDKILCIFCGAGNVRAGQWSGSLCVNDSLNTGAVFQYVEKAQKEGFAVILMNSNEIYKEVTTTQPKKKKKPAPKKKKKADEEKKEEEETETLVERIPIPGLDNEFKHVAYVWDNFINKVQPKHLVFIAHSYGGVLSSQLLEDRKKDIFDDKGNPIRLRALAFTDSVHKFNSHWSKPVKQFLKANSINFEQSKQPLNTKLKAKAGTNNVSAGTPIHELTSSQCFEPLWEFVLARVK